MDDIHKDGLVKLRLGVAPPETTPAPVCPFPKPFGRSNLSGMLFPLAGPGRGARDNRLTERLLEPFHTNLHIMSTQPTAVYPILCSGRDQYNAKRVFSIRIFAIRSNPSFGSPFRLGIRH